MKKTNHETNILTKDDTEYRTWMYKKIDGKVEAQIATASVAEKLYEDGWRMSPAEFSDNVELKNDPHFNAAADDLAAVLNVLLNIKDIKDKSVLADFADKFLNIEIDHTQNITKIRKQITNKAEEIGLLE